MKIFNLLIVVAIVMQCNIAEAQRLMDRSGKVTFHSHAPLEDIEAVNGQALAAMDLEAGTVAVSMLMRGFKFEKKLMEEHFNENYIESEKYPKATFKGNFTTKPSSWPATGKFSTSVTGELELHGVKQPLSANVDFENDAEKLTALVVFTVRVEDFDIKIPGTVLKNIAEEVKVTGNFKFLK